MPIHDDRLTFGRIADEWSRELAEAKAPGRLPRDELFHKMLKALWRGDFESDEGESCLSIVRPPKGGAQRADGRFVDAKHELAEGRYEPVNRRWLLAAMTPVAGLSLPHKSRLWPSGETKGNVSWVELKNEIPWNMLTTLRPDEYDRWFRRSYLEKLLLLRNRFGEFCNDQRISLPEFWFHDTKSKKQSTSTIKAERDCENWLIGLMDEDEPPQKAKADYRADAKGDFGVGIKAFDRTWANAIMKTGNTEWSRPGRKSIRNPN